MKQKRLTIIAVACGAVCALCVFAFMGVVQGEANAARAEALARYGGEQIDVCVAARDISSGERVDAAAVETKLWVADLLPEGAVNDSSEIVGKTATSSILKGEVFTQKRFDHGQSDLDVPVGQMAISIPAKTVQAVGGAVRPGMSVDIYAAGDSGATLIAQGVKVLATSSDEGGSLVSDASWVTVAVDSEKVQELITASSKYDLCIVLPGAAPDEASGDGAEVSSEEGTELADGSQSPKAKNSSNGGSDGADSEDGQGAENE